MEAWVREDRHMQGANDRAASHLKALSSDRRGPVAIPLIVTIAIVALLATSVSVGQGLYGPDAPRDASYVRLVNAASSEPIVASLGGSDWDPLGFAEISPYRLLQPGEHAGEVAGRELRLTTLPESFTTLVALPDQTLVLEDTPLRDVSRGVLSLYNLTSDATLSLRAGDGTVVLAAVPPRSTAGLAISEAEVELVVYRGEERLASLPRRLYLRGEAHSVVVLPLDSEPQVVYARAGAEP
jgi:hypothetical protein